jgi:antitoxin HicB
MAEKYTFSIVLEPQEEGGFTVLVPALPEVITEGDNEQEALANAEEAIRAILAFRRDNGIPIPADARPDNSVGCLREPD